MRALGNTAVLILPFGPALAAQAELGEWAIGVDGTLVLPSLSDPDSTAFAFAIRGVGVHAQYGLLDDLFIDAGGMFGIFGARVASSRKSGRSTFSR